MFFWYKKDSKSIVQIEPSVDERDRFFANLSHEVRTPVNGIVGFTQLLKETELSEEQNELVNTIHGSSMHLLTLVGDILDFSKINADKLELESVPFDLFHQVEDTVETYAALSQKKGIELGVYIDPEINPMLIGDPTKLSQVIGNLVSNAIKFTDALGEVSVSVTKVTEDQKKIALEFSIKDTGIGIEDDNKEKVFDAFVQANSSISREFGGTGLGLAISSKMVKLMGGKLKLYSSFGIGSDFSFTLKFEKTRSQERKIYHDFYMGLRAGLVLPKRGSSRVTDMNLGKNIDYLGVDFNIYYADELFAMESEDYPNILFVDHQYNSVDFEDLSKLGIKTILITTISSQNKLPIKEEYICKNLYKPINLTKVIRVFEDCTGDKNIAAAKPNPINKNFHGYRALVVDDNEINQKLLLRLLVDMQMDVEVASDGEEAVEFYKSIEFDIILMDMEMPIMDGMEAYKAILDYEEEHNKDHTPVIALTANVASTDIRAYEDAGMDGFVPKPIDIEVIVSYLNRYVAGKKLTQQINKVEQKFAGSKVLVIEENDIDQKLIERALASKDMSTVFVAGGINILDSYRDERFDLMFVNASTPVMNGAEITDQIRELERRLSLDRTPIIVMLPPESSDMHFGIYEEMGADGYIIKPLDIDEIKFQIDRYMEEDKHIEIKIDDNYTSDNLEEKDQPIEEVFIAEETDQLSEEDTTTELTEADKSPEEVLQKETYSYNLDDIVDTTKEVDKNKKDNSVETSKQVTKEEIKSIPSDDKKTSQYTITYIDIPLSK